MTTSQFTGVSQGQVVKITHVDGPPMAYFEQIKDDGSIERISYVTVACFSRNVADLADWVSNTISAIENSLHELVMQDTSPDTKPCVLWRKRPIIELDDSSDLNAKYLAYLAHMRVATIPMLTAEQWNDIGHVKKEGEEAKELVK